ncbi:sensor histidine kinase [Corynebacterium aquatimens]|uniref:Signal transduction histidine kinase n=1 Tax=Corynebacterium aquatimens TaxID=1190508 RepID=A0A931DZ76_9CORY|nr:sensor histidine kinase [Corynebacterium aquatimens]MBG6122810.1 signal transduction histidine kinase [Corynebacterium aquatimens]WJY66855.1 Sensor histidine kinase LiaS [Corynebacterium aquatimens]
MSSIRTRRPRESLAPSAPVPDSRALDTGVTALTLTLLVVSLGGVMGQGWFHGAILLTTIVAFGGLYLVGVYAMRAWSTPLVIVWILALTGVWVVAMMESPVAIYWVFTLFFVCMRAFAGWVGILCVGVMLLIAVAVQVPDGLSFGGVMGPAVSALVVVLIAYAFQVIARVSSERAQLIDELVSTRDKLAETERAAGVVQERQRLAHEIHDTVAQGLSSIQMLLHAAERDLLATGLSDEQLASPLRRIEVARRSASDNLAETRAMIAALTPAPLSENTLVEALERIAQSCSQTGDVEIEVDVAGTAVQMPMRSEAGLLRIAQGAMGNVVKHAEATRCRVTLTYEPDEVRLDVVDNGKGFDVEATPARPSGLGHIGLDAMKTRAQELGGDLVVESSPGGPTAVSVSVPLASTPSTHPNRPTGAESGNLNQKIEEVP